jgi:hypothetical protein
MREEREGVWEVSAYTTVKLDWVETLKQESLLIYQVGLYLILSQVKS